MSNVFADGERARTSEEVTNLELAATAALSPSISDRDASWRAEAPDVADSWQSAAGLRATARRASLELNSKAAERGLYKARNSDVERDPCNRWTDLITIAPVLFGLLAASAAAEALTSESGPNAEETTISELTEVQGELLTAVQSLDDTLDRFSTGLSDEPVDSGLPDDRSKEPVNLSALDSIETQLKAIVNALDVDDPIEIQIPLGPSDALWGFARKMCNNDGSARQIVEDAISLWDANTSSIGANPNTIEEDSHLVMNCSEHQ
ncbi:MAG: hypothetical protein ACI91O_001206 [Candidatus Poriferisodalaceae bacterium]